jgi:filamentous hemagglutinin family protein
MCGFFKQQRRALWLTGSLCLCILGTANTAKSQIVPDGTLLNNSGVTLNGNTFAIEGGTRAGSNLFHSFQEFSVPTGSEAFFNNTSDIQNILSRVTGSNISNIDGTLRANGMANLFLINPNGIVFGSNAQLNIGGSFIGSTANSLKFSDGSEFSATNPQTPPLLSINVPIGLQFGSNPGRIVNQSQASSNAGLQVLPGQTIALVGGDVSLNGGNLTALQGRVELGSVASSGLVSLTPTPLTPYQGGAQGGFALDYEGIQNFGNINLSDAAAVNASGLGGGTIRVRGGQVTLTQGSRLVADTFGNFNGGGIDIQASQFRLQEGAFASTSTFGAGTGGNLTVRADAVELTGTTPLVTSQQLLTGTFNPLNLSNGLFSVSAGSGTAGNITVDARQLRVRDGANLFTPALLDGNGGNLIIRVSELAELTNGSLLFTGTAGSGNAGNLAVTAKQLRVLDGTALSTTPGGTSTGRGGNLTVTADSVELRGTPAGAVVPGGLFTTALGTGDAGDISVTTGQLVVADGTQISTSTSGGGRGGNLTVTADSVELNGKSADGRFLGGLLASSSLLTVPGQQGNSSAGDLTVTTRRLSVQNGAQITGATGSGGTAGTLRVNASESVDVSGFATGVAPSVEAVSFGTIGDGIVPSAIETNTRGTGDAGDLMIYTGRLTVRDGAEVGVRSTSTGSAGNLNIRADSIVLSEQGTLSAVNVSEQRAGNIYAIANFIFLDKGKITATSIGGQGGDITLQVGKDLILRNGSEISTRAGTADMGGGNGGNITINAEAIAAIPKENSDITANAFRGRGGNIKIAAQGVFGFEVGNQTPLSDITASSTLGINGVVEINRLGIDPSTKLVELPTEVVDATQVVATGCAADEGSSFVITGRGGLPEDPTQSLRGRTVWRDVRNLSVSRGTELQVRRLQVERSNQSSNLQPSNLQPSTPIEAQGWVINADGQVELVADASQATPQRAWHRTAQCYTPNSP